MSLELRKSTEIPHSHPEKKAMPRPHSTGDLQKPRDKKIETLVTERLFMSNSDGVTKQQSNWWAYNDGSGPTMIGNIYRVAKTAFYASTDALRSPFTETQGSSIEALLSNRSPRLNVEIMRRFFDSLKPEIPEGFEYSAFFCCNTINYYSLNWIKRHFESLRAFYDDEKTKKMCWAIPIIHESQSCFYRLHIIIIVIRDQEIFFLDSKGITSDRYEIKHSEGDYTLAQVRDLCLEVFRPNINTKIHENREPFQWDINNCGVYVAMFVHECLINRLSLQEFRSKMANVSDTLSLRELIAKKITPPASESASIDTSHSDAEVETFDDIDI